MKTDAPIKSAAPSESPDDGLKPHYNLNDPGTFKPCTHGNTLSELAKGSLFALPFAAIRAAVKYYFISRVDWITKGEMKNFLPYSTLRQLETLRLEFNKDHESFLKTLFCSSALASKMIQRDYFDYKTGYPQCDENEILLMLLTEFLIINSDLIGNNTNKDMSLIKDLAGDAMKEIFTLGELCLFIESMKRKSLPDYYESAIGKNIEKIIWDKA